MESKHKLNVCILLAAIGLYFGSNFAHADFSEAIKNYKNKNFTDALADFRRSAVLGHKESQFDIGVMYYRGEGVEKNLIEAFAWTALSATDKNPKHEGLRDMIINQLEEKQKDAAIDRMQALFSEMQSEEKKLEPVIVSDERCRYKPKQLKRVVPEYPAYLIREGKELSTDIEYSIDKNGFVRDYSIVISTDKEFDKAIYKAIRLWRYEPVVIDGHAIEVPSAMVRMRFRISDATLDSAQVKAYVKSLRDSMANGNPAAMYTAAYIGELVPELKINQTETTTWFYQAAQSGYPDAEYKIGKSLFQGDGCKQDVNKGMRWLMLAAEERSADAEYFLGVSLLGSEKVIEDKSKAIGWLNKAANNHHEKAMIRLAWILATDNDEKTRDPKRALSLVDEVYKNYPDKLRSFETLAAVQAANGNFDDAVNTQKSALKEAKSIEYPLDDVQARLNAYQNKQPWFE